jgi:hypothetical protein
MVWIVALPFAALMLGMVVIRMMRSIRAVGELRAKRPPDILDGERRKPADDFSTTLPGCRVVIASPRRRRFALVVP